MNFRANWKKKYPTLGQSLKNYPKSVSIYIYLLVFVVFLCSSFTFCYIPSKSPIWYELGIFICIFGGFQIFYNRLSFQEGGKELMDIAILLEGISIIIFQNIWVFFLLNFIAIIINYLYGIRRIHAILFNLAKNITVNIPLFWILYYSITINPVLLTEWQTLILGIFIASIIFIFSTLFLKIIIALSIQKSLWFLLKNMDFAEEFFQLTTSFLLVCPVLISKYLFLPIIFSFFTFYYQQVKKFVNFSDQQKTQQKLKDLELEQTKKKLQLEKLESLSLLASGMAHDFNNVLSSLMGNLVLLRMTEDTLEEEEIFKDITEALDHAKIIVKQLVELSRESPVEVKQLDLNKEVIQTAHYNLRGTNCTLENQLNPTMMILFNRVHLNQIISNLFLNSIQAMPTGGRVNITSYCETITNTTLFPLKPGSYGVLEISDTGEGIPVEMQHKIFEPYFTMKTSGTGLGLATAYSLMKKNSGYIRFESEINVGTTFFLYFPLYNEELDYI